MITNVKGGNAGNITSPVGNGSFVATGGNAYGFYGESGSVFDIVGPTSVSIIVPGDRRYFFLLVKQKFRLHSKILITGGNGSNVVGMIIKKSKLKKRPYSA